MDVRGRQQIFACQAHGSLCEVSPSRVDRRTLAVQAYPSDKRCAWGGTAIRQVKGSATSDASLCPSAGLFELLDVRSIKAQPC